MNTASEMSISIGTSYEDVLADKSINAVVLATPHTRHRAQVEAGSTCVVFGAGMVGLGAVAGCRLQGAERIICVDPSEERLHRIRRKAAV